jgi:hypothetical protein
MPTIYISQYYYEYKKLGIDTTGIALTTALYRQ